MRATILAAIIALAAPLASAQYVPRPSGGAAVWGGITGTLTNQTDLQTSLDGKALFTHTANATVLIGPAMGSTSSPVILATDGVGNLTINGFTSSGSIVDVFSTDSSGFMLLNNLRIATGLIVPDTGWTANASAGDKTVVVADYTVPDFTGGDTVNIPTVEALAAQVVALSKKVQALQTALAASLKPNQ